jgi:hypothetical protein
MSRSIFDPTGGTSEHSGSTFTPPDADQISHLPDEFNNPHPSPQTGQVDFQPPPEPAAIEVTSEDDGRLLTLRLTGKLHEKDYKIFAPIVDSAIQKHGKIRMVVQMHNFHGWDAGALWEDVKFDVTHFNKIERLAIIGEKTWEKWMAVFCKPFTTATVKYFDADQFADARKWIAEV